MWIISMLIGLSLLQCGIFDEIKVNLKAGIVRGFREKILNKDLNVFLGIPYAKPPIGELRFKKPEGITEFKPKVINANKWQNACIQSHQAQKFVRAPISEDCLYLNIWIPLDSKSGEIKKQKAVMVFIHGGAFMIGASSTQIYNASILSSYGDVVVVTLNYRLGALGFMYGGSEEIPGNMGLWDQIMALQWVKENIENFGGDKSRITIFGESAGSMSISLLSISPISRDLFKTAILMSGVSFDGFACNRKEEIFEKSENLVSMLNCESTEENEENSKAFSKSTIECLRKADATKFGDIFPLMFWPLFGDSLLPHSIKLSLKKGDFKRNSSFLIGTVVNDGTVVPIVMKNNPKQSMIIVLHEFKRKNVKKLINYYFSNVNGSNLNESTWAFYNAFTDISFRCPSAYFAKILSQFNSIYQYIFARKPNVNINPFKKSGFEPGHHDEMPFTFGMVPDAEDFAVSMHWMKMLTHFAKHGKLPWQSYQNSNPQKSPFYKFIGDPQNNEVILSDIYTTCEKLFPEIFKKMY